MHCSLAPRGDLRCRRELPAFLSGAGESRARRGPLVLSRRGAASCKQLFLLCGLSKQESICPSAARACLLPGSVLFFFFFSFLVFFSSVFAARRNKQRGRRRAAAGKRYLLKHNAAVPFGREAALTSRQRGFSRTPSPRRVVPTSRRLLRNADSPRGSVLKAGRPRGSASIWPPEPGGGGEKWCRAPGVRGAGGRVL